MFSLSSAALATTKPSILSCSSLLILVAIFPLIGTILISARVLSQNGDKQIYKEIISSFESIQKDIDDLSEEFISLGADKLILT